MGDTDWDCRPFGKAAVGTGPFRFANRNQDGCQVCGTGGGTRQTFLSRNAVRYKLVFLLSFAYAFDMYLFCLPKLSTMFALSDGATFLLDFEQGAVRMIAGG